MSTSDLATSASRDRKRQDSALFIPLFGTFLFLSPFITVFTGSATVFGLPLIFVYIFGAWLGLVVIARITARRLDKS